MNNQLSKQITMWTIYRGKDSLKGTRIRLTTIDRLSKGRRMDIITRHQRAVGNTILFSKTRGLVINPFLKLKKGGDLPWKL